MDEFSRSLKIKLRSTYFLLAVCIFVLITLISAIGVAFHAWCMADSRLLLKFALVSFVIVAILRLVDDWFFDKNNGLRVACGLHLWPKNKKISPLAENAKNYVWEGYAIIEIALFAALAAITISAW